MNWLEQIAPTIASCLGGPLAGLAVTAISKALGVNENDVNKTIESGNYLPIKSLHLNKLSCNYNLKPNN